jgi:uncharacterized protein (DUF1697 family)
MTPPARTLPRGGWLAAAGVGQDAGVPTHVALLRGINVGGSNKVTMADLRDVVTSLGHTGVSTYIQSGNVLFTAGGGAARASSVLAADLERAIEQAFGLRLRVVVLSRAELAQVISDNPYQAEPNPKYVHAMFFPAEPGPEVRESVAAAERQAAEKGGRDEATVVGRTLFLHTPDGYGRSELAARLARARGPAATGTARNMATVTKLLALCDA